VTRAFEWMPAQVPPDTNRQVFVYAPEYVNYMREFPRETCVACYDITKSETGACWFDSSNYHPLAKNVTMWAEIPWPDDVDVMRHFRQFNPYEP